MEDAALALVDCRAGGAFLPEGSPPFGLPFRPILSPIGLLKSPILMASHSPWRVPGQSRGITKARGRLRCGHRRAQGMQRCGEGFLLCSLRSFAAEVSGAPVQRGVCHELWNRSRTEDTEFQGIGRGMLLRGLRAKLPGLLDRGSRPVFASHGSCKRTRKGSNLRPTD